MASLVQQRAGKAICEKSTIAYERQNQDSHILIALDDIAAPRQGTKGAVYNDDHDSSR